MTLYVMVFEYISIMGTLSTEQAVSRKIFDYKNDERITYISSIFWFYLLTTVILLVVGLVLSDFISNWIMDGSYYIYIIVLLSGALSVFYKLFNLILVNEKKSNEVLVTSVSNSVVSSSSAIVFISLLKFGLIGRFIGQLLGVVFYITVLFYSCSKHKLFRVERVFNYSLIKETMVLSLPLIFSTIMVLLFSYADRIFLKVFSGDVSVGIYGLALIVGKLITMIFDALSKAFFPAAITTLNNNYSVGVKNLESIANKYYFFLILISILLYIISPYLVSAISTSEYGEATLVMPFIFLGIVLGGSYKIPGTILMYHKVVWFYPLLAVVSFFINAGFNYILIPSYGLLGAGVATFLGYIVYSFSLQALSFKYFSFKYILTTISYYAVLLIIAMFAFYDSAS